jgi:hypothetical protein
MAQRTVRVSGLPGGAGAVAAAHALLVPFGPLQGVRVVGAAAAVAATFDDAEDAAAARDNLDGAELQGCTLHVAFFDAAEEEQPARGAARNRAVWAEPEAGAAAQPEGRSA